VDNNINDNFNKDIIVVLTTTSGNFFYNDYSIKHFITLNRLILIETAKNIVTSINNNAFIYGLTSSIEPSGIEPSSTEPSTVRRGDVSNKSSNNKGKSATYFYNNNNDNINIENLTVNIDFLNCYSDDDG
jgi:hypothetical protein